jgi:hypothetical protein
VRLVIARCSVDYVGRLTAHLPPATRLLVVKADGSVLVHSDGGSYKPLNWMSAPCTLVEADTVWTVTNKAGEQLIITIDAVEHDSSHELGVDPGLVKDGVESHLQRLLAEQIHTLGDGYRLVRREYPTPIGPVDILARDPAGAAVAVEIKRRGEIDSSEGVRHGADRTRTRARRGRADPDAERPGSAQCALAGAAGRARGGRGRRRAGSGSAGARGDRERPRVQRGRRPAGRLRGTAA